MTALGQYQTERLVVLTLWQPWASLCVAPDPAHDGQPGKRHETRHWLPFEPPPFALAIHAAKRYGAENRLYFEDPVFRAALKRCGYYPGDPRPFLARKLDPPAGFKPVPLGAIVGLAIVDSIWSVRTPPQRAIDLGVRAIRRDEITDDDWAFGHFVEDDPKSPNTHRYAWRLRDTIALPEPIPFSGRQDPLYDVDLETREKINAQLRGMEANR